MWSDLSKALAGGPGLGEWIERQGRVEFETQELGER